VINLKIRKHLGDLDIDGRKTLTWISHKQDVAVHSSGAG